MERRFGTLLAATRTALIRSRLPKSFWSTACLCAIDEEKIMSIKHKDGKVKAPNNIMPGVKTKVDNFIPFGQIGYIVDTTSAKRKLHNRALKARYLRKTQDDQYLVLVVDSIVSEA